jgi:hypothetical protein
MENPMPVFEDDPDAPPSEEEKRAATALRKSLEASAEGSPVAEVKWLAAHLRRPTAEDALGDVRGWRLSRGAREAAQARKLAAEQRGDMWTRIGRSLTSSAGLLAAAGLLLFLSWAIVGQGQHYRGSSGGFAQPFGDGRHRLETQGTTRAAQMLLFRQSFKRQESPAKRIDLMIATRLAERRIVRPSDLDRSHLPSLTPAGLSSAPVSAWRVLW